MAINSTYFIYIPIKMLANNQAGTYSPSWNIVPKMPGNSIPNISITTGQAIDPPANRMTRSLNDLENIKIWTFAFENQSHLVQIVENLYNIYEIKVQQLLLAIHSGGVLNGTSLYVNVSGFSPTSQYSSRTYTSQGTNGSLTNTIAFVPGIPGICHPQPYAIFKNGEGNIPHKLTFDVTDYTGAAVAVDGYLTLKIKCLSW